MTECPECGCELPVECEVCNDTGYQSKPYGPGATITVPCPEGCVHEGPKPRLHFTQGQIETLRKARQRHLEASNPTIGTWIKDRFLKRD